MILLKSTIMNLTIKYKLNQKKYYIKYTSVVNKKRAKFKTVDHLGTLIHKKYFCKMSYSILH